MKFILIFISLLMFIFGGIMSFMGCEGREEIIKNTMQKAGNANKKEVVESVNESIALLFIIGLVGFCLFVASLFL